MNDDAQKVISLNILVVDDDSNIRKTLSYCLAAEGYTVIAVSNPADAVEEAKRRSFDIAFVDLKLGEARRHGFDSPLRRQNLRGPRSSSSRLTLLLRPP